MATNSKIEWCDDTASFWWGCTKIAPGCKDCYALDIALRFFGDVWGPTKPRLMIESAAKSLLALNRKAQRAGVSRVVFINSMSDFFEDFDGPIVNRRGERAYRFENGIRWHSATANVVLEPATLDDLRRDAFQVFDECPWLRLMLLTKRPENIGRMWPTEDDGAGGRLAEAIFERKGKLILRRDNVRLGTSISDQPTANEAVSALVKCRQLSPVLFLSVEPLLGPISFRWARWQGFGKNPGDVTNEYDGLRKLDQIIVGNESNGKKNGRLGFATEAEWWDAARRIADECSEAGVAYFGKQGPINGRVSHDPTEWPHEVCRRREFPQEAESHA